VFKDGRGHPLVGYDLVRAAEDNSLGLPKGYPSPENPPDSKDFYMAVGKLAGDIAAQMRALAQSEARPPAPTPGLREEPTPRERIFLAAAPADDVDDLRDELAGLQRAQGCVGTSARVAPSHELSVHLGDAAALCYAGPSGCEVPPTRCPPVSGTRSAASRSSTSWPSPHSCSWPPTC
jgi:hypothetical protein